MLLLVDPSMIRLESILTPARSLVNVPGGSKKRVLEQISSLVAKELPELEQHYIFENLIAREKKGSTGFGNGIAIPHCRLSGLSSPLSAVLRLEQPVDFDAMDAQPVDLLFVLLVPEQATDEHLELLRQVAGLLDQSQLREKMRQASSGEALYQIILEAQRQF